MQVASFALHSGSLTKCPSSPHLRPLSSWLSHAHWYTSQVLFSVSKYTVRLCLAVSGQTRFCASFVMPGYS